MPQQGCGVVLSLFFQSIQRVFNLKHSELRGKEGLKMLGNKRMKSDGESENDENGNRIEREEKIALFKSHCFD
jgi:hypothetical protein